MFRRVRRAKPITSLLVAVLAAACSPSVLWGAAPGALPGAGAPGISDDAPDSASRLLVMRDFNRDGIVDMAEATSPAEGSSGTGLLTISLGQANGSFRQMALKTVLGHNPQSIVAGDFNKDGIEDLIVGDDDGTLLLFLGDGTGKLVAAGAIAHLDSVVSIAVADFNHDGIPDLAVSDWRASSVKVLLGVGDGSFRSGWPFPLRLAGTTPHLTAADFNDDGIPDLAVVYEDDDGDTFDVMLGNGTGSFTHSAALSLVRDPNSHCAPEIRLQ